MDIDESGHKPVPSLGANATLGFGIAQNSTEKGGFGLMAGMFGISILE